MAEIYILKCLSQSEANCSKSKIQAQRLLRFGFGGVGAFLSVSTIAKTYNFMMWAEQFHPFYRQTSQNIYLTGPGSSEFEKSECAFERGGKGVCLASTEPKSISRQAPKRGKDTYYLNVCHFKCPVLIRIIINQWFRFLIFSCSQKLAYFFPFS